MLIRRVLLVSYALAFVWSLFAFGVPVDRSVVMLWILAAFACGSIGRSLDEQLQMVKDWSIIVALYFAYDYSRGIADQIGMPVHYTGPRNVDRLLFLGNDPTVWMQRHFYEPESVRWYDVAGSLIYMTHFILPVAPLLVLWLRNREKWVRYIRRLALTFSIAVTGFILYPAAPPWLVSNNQQIDTITRITGRGWNHVNMHTVSKVWDRGAAVLNGVAAMPSLHAGLNLLVALWFAQGKPRWIQALLMLMPLSMAATLVYFGEHWVIDCVAGWLVVVIAWTASDWWERRGVRPGSGTPTAA